MRITCLVSFFVLILFSSCNSLATPKITIATAANVHFAMEELAAAFTSSTNIECQLITSSSGKLTAQIVEGAPYDVFVAANMKYPQKIFKEGLATSPPKAYAYGSLVLWSMMENVEPGIKLLTESDIRHIAIANPKTAPYGTAALEVLTYHKLLPKIEHKLVYGESIAQTNRFITSKSAEIGFTAKSVVLSPKMSGQGQWVPVDQNIYTPIAQGVVVIKRKNADLSNAEQFHHFLFSDEAQIILRSYGYDIDKMTSNKNGLGTTHTDL